MTAALQAILPGFRPSPLQRAALERIREYRQELKRYGIQVRTAMELEFMVRDKDGYQAPNAVSIKGLTRHLESPSGANLPHIDKVEMEGDPITRLRGCGTASQYEVSVSDRGGLELGEEGKPRYRPEEVAAVVQRLKTRTLQTALRDSTCLSSPAGRALRLRPDFSPLPGSMERGATQPTDETSALHVNLSLADNAGRNLFTLSPRLARHCANATLEVQKQAALAFLPAPESLWRIGANSSAPAGFGIVTDKFFGANMFTSLCLHPGSARIENRLPGADADPFVALAVSMAALVDAVHKNVTLERTGENKVSLRVRPCPELSAERGGIPSKHARLAEDFERSAAMRELLGPRLHTEILKEYSRQSAVAR